MPNNLEIWDKVKQPPEQYLKKITAGRLKGKTDINPQWRYKAMTEIFGICGIGWKYEIIRLWNEPGSNGQIFAFSEIKLYIRFNNTWSDPIPGIGGSMLVAKESNGLHSSDEGYKMATTDALSVAMKMLGIAADIYAGLWDGGKYKVNEEDKGPALMTTAQKDKIVGLIQKQDSMSDDEKKELYAFLKDKSNPEILNEGKIAITSSGADEIIKNFTVWLNEYIDKKTQIAEDNIPFSRG